MALVTHALAQDGHLWGRKEVTMPLSTVTGADGSIRLTIIAKCGTRCWLASITQTR
jgi:hypothetical protein